MGENIYKQCDQQGINFQNTQFMQLNIKKQKQKADDLGRRSK